MKALTNTLIAFCLLFVSSSIFAQNDDIKTNWIENNRTEYIKDGGQIDASPEFTTKQEKIDWYRQNVSPNFIAPNADLINPKSKIDVRETVILPNEPTFPVYKQTGNKELDDANYLQLKQQWINNNQAKYDAMFAPEDPNPKSVKERLELESPKNQ